MTAKLVLLPLSNSESRKILKDSGKYPQKIEPGRDGSPKLPSTKTELKTAEQAYNQPRKTITLVLSKVSNIIELDSDSSDDESCDENKNSKVIYSKKYQDGSEAARVSLGRSSKTTGIEWTKISRAICEVSLYKPTEGGKVVIDLLDSADNEKLKSDTSVDYDNNKKPYPKSGEKYSADDGKLKSDTLVDYDNNKKTSPKSGDNDKAAIASLGMRKSTGDHYVWLDGQLIKAPLGREIEIQDGSILSLFGVTGLSYQIKLYQDDDKKKSPKKISPKKRKLNTHKE